VTSLDLALVGNAHVGALVGPTGDVVWTCLPRFDGDPVFCALLRARTGCDEDFGFFSVELAGQTHAEQEYLPNTPVLVTRLHDATGGAVEIVDFAPRFHLFGRLFCPMTLVRTLRPLTGSPLVRVRIRPATDHGRRRPGVTHGSNHIRYVGSDFVFRVTTDGSVTTVLEEVPFVLRDPVSFVLGPDETLQEAVFDVARRFREYTVDYWQDWVRNLSIPYEWQDAIIRAAITLKLNAFDDTGAVVAALTTSIPEASDTARTWDYRYCWLRDAYFVVNALNRLNATRTMERYLAYIINVAARAEGRLQPLYRVSGHTEIEEREIPWLPGYRGMGPVRVGNGAYRQVQNDVYGAAILAVTHVFFDRRLPHAGDEGLFLQLEGLGARAAAVYAEPDAGPWERRGDVRVHTFSSVMCWVACDRLAKIAARLGFGARAAQWRGQADAMHRTICARGWNSARQSFVSTFGGEEFDASLLLLAELGFLPADDPRFAATVTAVERELRDEDFVFRYREADDFGVPQNAFVVCTFWYIDALVSLGRRDEARALFEAMLARRTRHGLLSEHIDPRTGELWGNFPQTYSMVGLINSATRLSIPWAQGF
jgi:GH15 family glucan-1,4-alpha-glucosidase